MGLYHIPQQKGLEYIYFDVCFVSQFVVVGVHSAKFDNEKDSEAIRNAVLRYDITHPVSLKLQLN